MNENDKILINAYFDGDLTSDEIKYVESLLEANPDAKKYAENIKRANIEINSYFDNQDIKDLKSDINAFVSKLALKREKFNFINFVKNFFTPQSFIGYALTASFVYFIMLPVNENVMEQSFFGGEISSFSKEVNNYYYEKYRGAEDLADIRKDYIIETINKMIESKTINSVMNYGADSYFIKVEDLALDNELIFCLNGYILNNGINTKFLFCKSPNDETITYLN